MALPLPRYLRFEQKLADMANLEQILADVDLHPDGNGSKPRVSSADGHHWQRMRGTPIIAKGVSGTMPHTNPLAEVLRKEAWQRQR